MTHRADIPQVFWSEEDWEDEIAELEGRAVAWNGTAQGRYWAARAKEARRAFEGLKG